MPGGAYSALSGMRTRLDELDRLAADLANVSTVGYKTERSAKTASERDEFALALESAVDVAMSGKKIDFRPGIIATTGRDLDVAIDGSGFFAIQTAAGERYTRNGSFSRRADGTLTTSSGDPVLGEHPGLRGFIFANGFSGHGLMMSPATGKIVSELVRTGRSTTFNVSIFAPDRFERGALVHDAATI